VAISIFSSVVAGARTASDSCSPLEVFTFKTVRPRRNPAAFFFQPRNIAQPLDIGFSRYKYRYGQIYGNDMNHEDALKAIAHPVRLKFLEWLKEPEQHFNQAHPFTMGVCAHQFEISGLSQSTVSSHLSALQAAGLVRSRKVGQWNFYERDEENIAKFLTYLNQKL
jgi:ArsR family transcriptional regulator